MSRFVHVVKRLALLSPLGLAAACNSSSAAAPAPMPAQVQAPAVPSATTAPLPPTPVVPAPSAAQAHTGRLLGIDVSHYQPDVQWETVKSNVSFVFIKATDSTSGADPRFAAHWSGAKKAGLPRGAYHFFHPKHDVDTQVANFTKHVKADPGELPPVLDVEEFKDEYQSYKCEQLADMVKRFSQGVEKELGRKPMIYTNHQTWQQSFCDHPYFVDHPLWLAAYTQSTEPKLPKGWTRWNFWQYTESGKVTGISGQVDQSYFNGSLEELKALLAAK
ncbi:MAG TPA: GH25 family lysozyme [Archangium sp.]|jgi:lysozyme|uniref:glycoside hydrolase family 25 protein n=1 Tax=Archangium sp. TaxID=1872627 RepID=UPI002ED7B3E2